VRTAAQRLGDAAETLVAERLAAGGWLVHARNVRVGRAEIDLIATDPGPPPALVFVEVRGRASRDYGQAEETVDHRKRDRLHRAAFGLLDRQGERPTRQGPAAGSRDGGAAMPIELPRLPLRFDLVVVEPGGRMRHHRHAW
jgi:putative endonuclease